MMKTLKEYIDEIMAEENTQGDVGTAKLANLRKRQTPGQPQEVPEPLKDFQNHAKDK